MEAVRYTFNKQTFRSIVTRTIENDLTCMGLIRGARLDTVALEDGEAPEDFALRLYDRAVADSKVFELLGCMLVPDAIEDLAWSPKVMAETAAILRGITEESEKRQIQGGIVAMITGFFQSGLVSLRISRRSSSQPGVELQPVSEPGATTSTATGT